MLSSNDTSLEICTIQFIFSKHVQLNSMDKTTSQTLVADAIQLRQWLWSCSFSVFSFHFLRNDVCLFQGWGLLSQFSPFRYFPNFSEWWIQWLPEWYQVHIWQVSPQLCCGDTWQIWTSLKVSNIYFCKINIFRNGEINERSFSNPHPRTITFIWPASWLCTS